MGLEEDLHQEEQQEQPKVKPKFPVIKEEPKLSKEERKEEIERLRQQDEAERNRRRNRKKAKRSRMDSILANEEEELAYREYEYARFSNAHVPDEEEIPDLVLTKDLIRYVAKSCDYQISEVEDVIRHLIHVVRYLLIDCDASVFIRGLGTLRTAKNPGYVARSTLVDKQYYIPPYKYLHFRQDKMIKEEINKTKISALTYEVGPEDIAELVRNQKANAQYLPDGLEIEYRLDSDREITDAEYDEWLTSFDQEGPLESRQNRVRKQQVVKKRYARKDAKRKQKGFDDDELDDGFETVKIRTGEKGRPRTVRLPVGAASGPIISVEEYESIVFKHDL